MSVIEEYLRLLSPPPPPVGNPGDLRDGWWSWHRANPHIYRLFKRFTYEAINAGVTRTSAWLVVNRIRWETTVVTRGGDFKISNDYIALYARFFLYEHPEHDGLFVLKEMKR